MESQEAYSRLFALSKLNVVPDYGRIRDKTAIIVGIGGVGSVAAEMLTRCGVGRLILIDYDTVEMANMNRMFFTPDQVGMYKVEAAKATLEKISLGNTTVLPINGNICMIDSYNRFIEILKNESSSSHVLVLCCVDNYAARVTVNRACLEANQVWIESGVSETAMSGHVQFMFPGSSACFECAPPGIMATKDDEKTIVRPGVCAASLPTTMSIIAGLMVQAALKYFLGFGKVGGCLGYEALGDFFPSYDIKPNPDCASERCRAHQKTVVPVKCMHSMHEVESDNDKTVHESNDWGIEIVAQVACRNPEDEVKPSRNLESLSVTELMNRLRNN